MLTILQARMSSTRLPGKVLMPLAGEPMLARQIERVRRAKSAGRIVVATSTDPSDDAINVLCRTLHVACFRGSLKDVLGRFHGALRAFGPAETVVRLTGDCPLTDPEVIDATIDLHFKEQADYTSNTGDLTFPKGLDVEVFKAEHLEAAFREAHDPYEREHVTPFLYRHPERFVQARLECDPPMGHLRWTVDTPDDYAFTERVYDALYRAKPEFTSEDIARLTERWPQKARDDG
jgi:spore coat polysaccharide biosynthesis protein SpsF